MPAPPLRRAAALLLAVLGLALLAWIAHRVSWNETSAALRQARLGWLAAGMLLGICSMGLRALRLRTLLGRRAGFPPVWRSVSLGYFCSLFLPLGGGELVKVASLRLHAGFSLARAGAALSVDRLFDICTLAVLLAGVAARGMVPDLRMGPVLVLGGAAAALLSLLLLLLFSGDLIRSRVHAWAEKHPGRHPWIGRFEEVQDQVEALRSPARLAGLALIHGLIFALDFFSFWCAVLAFGFGAALPAAAVLRLTLLVMVAFGLPLLPGGLGSHQAACILALRPFGVPEAGALALSLASEATHLIALTGVGIAAMAWGGLNPLRLLRRARGGEAA